MTKPDRLRLTRRWRAASRTAGILSGLCALAGAVVHLPLVARLGWIAALALGVVWAASLGRAVHIDGHHLAAENGATQEGH